MRFTNGNPTLYYTYDAQGNRLSKRTNPDFANYYVRDAQGNALATYALKKDSLYLIEQNLYGSSRLGVKNLAILAQIDTQRQQMSDTLRIFEERVGAKNYELSNHLGNVLATIGDKTIFNYGYYSSIDSASMAKKMTANGMPKIMVLGCIPRVKVGLFRLTL